MQTIVLILQLLPALIAAMKAIEAAIPDPGKGAEKLAAIREIVEVTDKTAVALWPQISSTITILVKLFNSTAWKK